MDNLSLFISNPTAYCTPTCKNGGVCVGPHICKCAYGWVGGDCTTGDFIS